MELQLRDQVAVVVGGAKGIGGAIAESLAAEGCHIALLDIDPVATPPRAEALAERYGVTAQGYVVDVRDSPAVRQVASQIEQSVGPTSCLTFAVGAGSGKYGFPFWDLEPSDLTLFLHSTQAKNITGQTMNVDGGQVMHW